jgi:K+-transporting ATPase c subunit
MLCLHCPLKYTFCVGIILAWALKLVVVLAVLYSKIYKLVYINVNEIMYSIKAQGQATNLASGAVSQHKKVKVKSKTHKHYSFFQR